MSVVVAEGVVTVTADSKDLGKQIAKDVESGSPDVEASGNTLGGSITSGLGRGLLTVGKVAGAAIGAATLAVGAGVGAIISGGVKFDAAMQNYTAAFTPLLGGADQAKAKLGELSSFAASTPFELEGLAQASQTMLAFGESSANLMPDLKMLGDISQGNQQKLSSLALVYGQVQSSGHLMGQDLLQLTSLGFNPLNSISQKTGESMDQLHARMAAGQISFQEVRDAMVTATSAGGMFYGSMDLGAKTLTGAWSSTLDGARILSGGLVLALTPALTGILTDGINPLLGGLVGLINGTDGAQAQVDAASKSLIASVGNLGPAVASIATNLGTVLTAIGPAIGGIVTALVSGIVTLLPSLISVASQLVLTLVTGIATAAPRLVTAAVPLLLSFVGSLVGMLPMLLQTGVDVLLALVTGITTALPTLIPQVVTAIVGSIATLFAPENLTALLTAGLALLTGLVQGILTALPVLIAALPGIIIGIVTFLIGAIPQLINAGISLLTSLVGALPVIIESIVNALPQIIVGIITALLSAIPQLISAGIKLLIALVTDLPTIIGAIVKAVPQIITGLVGAFTDPKVIGQMGKVGGDLIRGLWQGISDVTGWLWSKIAGFAGGIVNQVKGFFGIHSPSVVFRDEVGAMLGAGMAEGILASRSLVSDATAALSASAGINVTAGVPGSATGVAAASSASGAVPGPITVQLSQTITHPDPIIGSRQAARALTEYLGV